MKRCGASKREVAKMEKRSINSELFIVTYVMEGTSKSNKS